MYRKWTLLELVEKYPHLEDDLRSYDGPAGLCLLCSCLFDTLETIEKEKDICFSELYKKIEGIVEDV